MWEDLRKSEIYIPCPSQANPHQMTTRRSRKPDLLRDTFIPSNLNHVQEPDIRTVASHPPHHNIIDD